MSHADKKLDLIVKELFDQVVKDDIITDEEFQLITSIEIQVDAYIKSLEKALLDGVIDSEEKKKLSELKDKIMERAEEQANMDDIIDEDEREILIVLKNVLTKYFE